MKIESHKIDQALVAAGGKGTRLKYGGIEVPMAKSFISLEGKPLLYWNLEDLINAGINRLVIASDTKEKLKRAETVIDDLARKHTLREVELYKDQGLGTNGLPYSARHLLDEEFVFEYGHNIIYPDHYDDLRESKLPGKVVFSGFVANGYSDHPTVYVDADTRFAHDYPKIHTTKQEVAAPFVLDQEWIAEIPLYDFSLAKMVQERAN